MPALQAATVETSPAAGAIVVPSIVIPKIENGRRTVTPEMPALIASVPEEGTLPYQCAVVRISLVNQTDHVIGPYRDLFKLRLGVPQPAQAGRTKDIQLPPLLFRPYSVGDLQCIRLAPGQRLTVDVPVGGLHWSRDAARNGDKEVLEFLCQPLFDGEQSPTLGVRCSDVRGPDQRDLEASVALRAATPDEADRACSERLATEPRIARLLYDWHAIAEPAEIAGLERLVTTWPDSSYADYARFALARARLGAWGDRLPQLTERLAIRAADRPYISLYGDVALLRLRNQVSPWVAPADWARYRGKIMAGSDQSFRARLAEGNEIHSRLSASLAERKEALRLLDEIRRADLPFSAHALYLRYRAAELDEPEQLNDIAAMLERSHPCSLEWLTLLSQNYEHPGWKQTQAWVDYRVRTSTAAGHPAAGDPAAGHPATNVPTPLPPTPAGPDQDSNVVVVERYEYQNGRAPEPEPQRQPPPAVPPTPDRIRVETSVSAREVPPFQTIRMRYRLVNTSTETVGPITQPFQPKIDLSIDGAEPVVAYDDVAGSSRLVFESHHDTSPYRHEFPLYLRPGESTSISFPLVTGARGTPFFAKAGQVECRLFGFGPVTRHPINDRDPEFTASILVGKPAGIEDRTVHDALAGNPEAARALTAYDEGVTEEAVVVLERLLAAFPRSSYADYIRLALARALWGGDAAPGVRRPHGGDQYIHPYFAHRDPNFGRLAVTDDLNDGGVDMRKFWNRGMRLLTSDFHFASMPELIAERDAAGGDPVRLIRLQNKLSTMSGTCRTRREKIVKLLGEIDRERFPLAPVVTYYLARTLTIDDPQAGAAEYARLTTEDGNAFEWLNRLDGSSITDDDWLKYRLDPAKP